jgi:hypothetical protein
LLITTLSRREKLPLAVDFDSCTVYFVSYKGMILLFYYIEKMPTKEF